MALRNAGDLIGWAGDAAGTVGDDGPAAESAPLSRSPLSCSGRGRIRGLAPWGGAMADSGVRTTAGGGPAAGGRGSRNTARVGELGRAWLCFTDVPARALDSWKLARDALSDGSVPTVLLDVGAAIANVRCGSKCRLSTVCKLRALP